MNLRTVFRMLALLSLGCASRLLAGADIPAEAYDWKNVKIGGGGFVTGIVFHPAEKGLAYLRTDVGGAYRWDARAGRWIPLMDWMGPKDWNLLGIESLAVDPTDPEVVYAAAGTYTFSSASNGVILRSPDRGRTWSRTDLPFKFGGNESGRGNGERLAVDPNDPRVIFFGTRRDGLWRSGDAGAMWSRVGGFPEISAADTSVPTWGDRTVAIGVVCVRFDAHSGRPGLPTPVVYAAVSTRGASLWRSGNAGATWETLTGQPTGLRPNHVALAADGVLYVSYGLDPGPDSMADGAVWKHDPRSGKWTDVTPIKPSTEEKPFGYGAVAVDPNHPGTVLATTFCRWALHDEIFRSTDGGIHWRPLLGDAVWDRNDFPWTSSLRPHWIGDVEVDPFDPDHAFFTTGYGIWEGINLTRTGAGEAARWVFADEGLEETVPLGLASPPEGAPLVSAIADVDGFRHDDLGRSTLQFAAPPRLSNSEAIDFAQKMPGFLVRVGMARRNPGQTAIGAFSNDGGIHWAAFASEPPVEGDHASLAVSADGGAIVWASSRSVPYRSANHGEAWVPCLGAPRGLRIAADRVNPRLFYGFEPASGTFYTSDDGGARFLPSVEALRSPSGSMFPWAEIRAVPGFEGELWLAAGFGLFRSTDGGRRLSRQPVLNLAFAVGFGKAAPGSDRPAIFVAGECGETDGILRSDDGGGTWVRITDAAHRFGSVGAIIGDPRVYGRVYVATGGRGIIWGEKAADVRR